jgi:hypothetical protein
MNMRLKKRLKNRSTPGDSAWARKEPKTKRSKHSRKPAFA